MMPKADEEAWSIYNGYASISQTLGDRFGEAFDHASGIIRDFPNAYPPVFKNSRRVLLHKFPYHVYYTVHSDRIVIWAVFHAHRRLTSLKKRETKI